MSRSIPKRSLVVVITAAAALTWGSLVGDAADDDLRLPTGTYSYAAPEFVTAVELHYVDEDTWLKIVPFQGDDAQPQMWEVKRGDERWVAYGPEPGPEGTGYLSVSTGMHDLVPERFILDPTFLRHLERGTLPREFGARPSRGVAAAPTDRGRHQVTVPGRLTTAMDELSIVSFSPKVVVDPLTYLEERRSSGRYEIIYADDLPSFDDLDPDQPLYVDTPPPTG